MRIKRLYLSGFCSLDAAAIRARLAADSYYCPPLVTWAPQTHAAEIVILSRRLKRSEAAWQAWVEARVEGMRVQVTMPLDVGSKEACGCVDRLILAHLRAQPEDARGMPPPGFVDYMDTYAHLSGGRMHALDTRDWAMSLRAIAALHNDIVDMIVRLHKRRCAHHSAVCAVNDRTWRLMSGFYFEHTHDEMQAELERLQGETISLHIEMADLQGDINDAEQILERQLAIATAPTAAAPEPAVGHKRPRPPDEVGEEEDVGGCLARLAAARRRTSDLLARRLMPPGATLLPSGGIVRIEFEVVE